MKLKKTAAAVAAFTLLSSTTVSAKTLEFTIGSTDMYVSNASIEKVVLDCKPYTSNDRTLVPVRVISENFGAEVGWDDATREVSINTNDTQILLRIGSNIAYVNGEARELDVTPELTDSRTMVPLRFISEALGKRVEYIAPSEQVLISDENYAISVNDFDISIDDIRFYAAAEGLLTDKNQLSEALPILLNKIVENVALTSEAEKSGITFSDETANVYTDFLISSKDNIYKMGALLAPGIKMYTYDSYGSQYLDNPDITYENEEIRELYNSKYIRVKHILLKTFDSQTAKYYDDTKKSELKDKAEGILDEINNGGDFDSLHEQYNEDDESFFYPDGLTICESEVIPAFAEVAFSLEEGEISGIVETQYGYHIIKRVPLAELDERIFTEIKYSAIPTLATQNAEVVYHMTTEEIIEKLLN